MISLCRRSCSCFCREVANTVTAAEWAAWAGCPAWGCEVHSSALGSRPSRSLIRSRNSLAPSASVDARLWTISVQMPPATGPGPMRDASIRNRVTIPSAVTSRGGWFDRDRATSTRGAFPSASIAASTAFCASAIERRENRLKLTEPRRASRGRKTRTEKTRRNEAIARSERPAIPAASPKATTARDPIPRSIIARARKKNAMCQLFAYDQPSAGPSISGRLHHDRAELAARHVEAEVRPLDVAVEGADRCADGDLSPVHEPDVVVPESEAAESALVPQFEVRDPTRAAVLARECSDRRDADDRGA